MHHDKDLTPSFPFEEIIKQKRMEGGKGDGRDGLKHKAGTTHHPVAML